MSDLGDAGFDMPAGQRVLAWQLPRSDPRPVDPDGQQAACAPRTGAIGVGGERGGAASRSARTDWETWTRRRNGR